MGKVLVVVEEAVKSSHKSVLSFIREYFESASYDVEEFCALDSMNPEECRIKLMQTKCEYICTLDLACFFLTTLLDFPVYNILSAKQIHIVIDTEKLKIFKKDDFALNLFVFMPDEGKRWEEEYVNIPNLFTYPSFDLRTEENGKNKEAVWRILDTVRKECEIKLPDDP